MNHGNVDHGLAGVGEAFVVLAESSVASQPTKGTLHDPAPRQDYKPFDAYRPQHRLQQPSALTLDPGDQLAGIAAVGRDELQPRQQAGHLGQDQLGAVTILNVGGVNHDGQKQSQGVHQDV